MTIPTLAWYLDNVWEQEDWPQLPGPAYERRYGVSCYGPEAMGETPAEWDARMTANAIRHADAVRRQTSHQTMEENDDASNR